MMKSTGQKAGDSSLSREHAKQPALKVTVGSLVITRTRTAPGDGVPGVADA